MSLFYSVLFFLNEYEGDTLMDVILSNNDSHF